MSSLGDPQTARQFIRGLDPHIANIARSLNPDESWCVVSEVFDDFTCTVRMGGDNGPESTGVLWGPIRPDLDAVAIVALPPPGGTRRLVYIAQETTGGTGGVGPPGDFIDQEALTAAFDQHKHLCNHPYLAVHATDAVGDGVTDDSLAIQAAIDQVAASGGGTVHLNAAEYFIGTTLVAKSNVTLLGDGRGTILKTTSAISLIKAANGAGVDGFRAIDLTLDGGQTAAGGASDADGISLWDSTNCVITGCYITKTARDGIGIRDTGEGHLIANNFIVDPMEDGIVLNGGTAHRVIGNFIDRPNDGVLVKSSQYCVIANNTIVEPASGSAGISLGGDGASANDYNTVTGNTILGLASVTANGIYVTLSNFCTVSANTIHIRAQIQINGARDCVIEGNTLDGNDLASGISITTGGGVTSERCIVRSNVIKNITGTAKDGISVNSGSGHKIQGNWIETIADGHGINSGMPECEFVGNTVKDIGTPSTRYAIACTGDRCKVNGNTTETGLAGIFQTGDDFQVNDNDCDGGTRGIRVDSCVDGTIVGNLVRNSTNEGIYINAVTDAAVTGNRSHGNTYGIRSAGASDYLAVIGNSCRGNSTSAITLVGSNNVNTGNT